MASKERNLPVRKGEKSVPGSNGTMKANDEDRTELPLGISSFSASIDGTPAKSAEATARIVEATTEAHAESQQSFRSAIETDPEPLIELAKSAETDEARLKLAEHFSAHEERKTERARMTHEDAKDHRSFVLNIIDKVGKFGVIALALFLGGGVIRGGGGKA